MLVNVLLQNKQWFSLSVKCFKDPTALSMLQHRAYYVRCGCLQVVAQNAVSQ